MKTESIKIRCRLISFTAAVLICLTGCSDESSVLSKEKMKLHEKVRLQIVRHDDGYSYKAKALFPWGNDIDWKLENLQLLENDIPIRPKAAKRAEVIESGKGAFSHLDGDKLFISSSDGSNPLKNGKSYELSYNKEVYKKRAVYRTSKDHSHFKIDIPDKSIVRPYRLVIRNLDKKTSAVAKVIKKGYPDFSSASAMLKSILKPAMSDEEKAIAIWKFIVDWRYHYLPPLITNAEELHDPVRFLGIYGYGFCDDTAYNYVALSGKAGFKKLRVNWLSGHVVPEIYYDKSWHMLDPDLNIYYRDKDGKIASVEYLADHPELIINGPHIGDKKYRELVANIYSTKHNNRIQKLVGKHPYNDKNHKAHEINPLLLSKDEMIFNFFDNKYSLGAIRRDRPIPYFLGNGTITRNIQLEKLQKRGGYFFITNYWPYVLLDGKLDFSLKQSNTKLSTFYFIKKENLAYPLALEKNNNNVRVDFGGPLRKSGPDYYNTTILVQAPGDTDASDIFKSVTFNATFQFAPKTLAQISPGENIFDVFIDFPGDTKPKQWEGIEITLEWLEQSPR